MSNLPLLSKTLRDDRGAWLLRPGDLPERIRNAIRTFVANFVATFIDSPPEH
jgi:hypothetical protein